MSNSANKKGIIQNLKKTKYMVMGDKEDASQNEHLEMETKQRVQF